MIYLNFQLTTYNLNTIQRIKLHSYSNFRVNIKVDALWSSHCHCFFKSQAEIPCSLTSQVPSSVRPARPLFIAQVDAADEDDVVDLRLVGEQAEYPGVPDAEAVNVIQNYEHRWEGFAASMLLWTLHAFCWFLRLQRSLELLGGPTKPALEHGARLRPDRVMELSRSA